MSKQQGKAVNEDNEYAKFDKREAMCKKSVWITGECSAVNAKGMR